MEKLLKKLKKNYKEEIALFLELNIVESGTYWNQPWMVTYDKTKELLRIKQKQQKNLSKRFNILESLELEIIKAKQDTSTKQRSINL